MRARFVRPSMATALPRFRRTVATAAVVATLAVGAPAHAAAAGAASGTEPLPPLGALGANYNENLDRLNEVELAAARAEWVRGFYTLPEADRIPPADSPTIRSILDADAGGHRTILSLKFPKQSAAFPEPGSAEMAHELERLDRVLPLVFGAVDVVTIGNEPFIESQPSQRDERLNVFYETVARHVIDARERLCGAGCSTHLYMGALNRLDLPQNRTPAVERFLAFARETPEIEGVDLHPHVPDESRIDSFLDYTLPRLREDQTFLMTEFSLVWYWQQHMADPVPALFADRYGYDRDTPTWEVIGEAIENPFPSHKWNDLLSMSPWYESKKHLLRDVMERLRATGRLAVATYGFVQIPSMTSEWSATKAPWLLNSVYAGLTVQPRGQAMSAPGYGWLADFRALQ
ncbi:hypothetical protein GCM10017576_08310 [Microbacterium barkeri]|uniref:Uncharacterized protein n=2 Tax=Microbacterium barkeri TaxID=33917 RepID=A0A9W6LVU6_9MICO|nr:hypothetical protein [Microbacterium barkeri]MDI6942702.1 hypothetical protein [Microbacterium barkeri]MDR6875138.1 hypothetical protein [Microbacterium barkeri]GLJ60702.1 hypothetical protein GCM10017576_08310 [Microbacterium barkeri]